MAVVIFRDSFRDFSRAPGCQVAPFGNEEAVSETRPFDNKQTSCTSRQMAPGLADPRADLAAVAVQADSTAFEQVGDSGDGFAVISAHAAHGEDEITQAGVIAG